MQTSLLPAAEKVYTGNLATVEEDQRAVGSLPIVSLALLALALVAIGVGSVIMYGRTNRQFNIGLVVAAATVLLVIGWVVVATQLAAGEIERSRTEGSERFEQLAKARILAQKARTDETLELIARSDITAGEKSFHGHIDELGKLLDAAPAAAKDGVQKWTASHRKQTEAYEGGDYAAAVAQAIGPDPAASAAQFAAVESSLRDGIERTRETLRDRVSAAGAMAGMESHGDSRADGGRGVSGRRRVVAATQGVPMRTRGCGGAARSCAHRCRMWILRCAGIGVGRAGRTVAIRCATKSPPRRSRRMRTATGKPACAPVRCLHRVPCRRVRRWRRSPSADGSSSVSTRTRICSAFGTRLPGKLEGFDIDIAREIARSIFGDPGPHPAASASMRANESRRCSPVRWTWWSGPTRSPATASRNVAFSTVYFNANQKILTVKGSGIDSFAALSGKRVCAVSGTTSLSKLFELNPRPKVFGATTWTDCLLMLQQGQVDAISTDDVVLQGLAHQDPNVEVVGDSIADRALRHRGQDGEHRPGSIRQRCPRADTRRRNVAAALRGPAARARTIARSARQPRYED